MRKLLGVMAVFLYVLIFLTTNAFGENTENKKGEILNDNKTNVKNIMKSIDDVINHCNQTLIEKVLVDNGIVDKKTSYGDKISKGEFVKAILRIMGVTDEFAEHVEKCVTIEYDSRDVAFSRKSKEGLWKYKEDRGLYPYILLSEVFKIISKDKFEDTENSYPDDDIMLEECLAIMNGCLNEETTDDVISEAEKNGLIKSTDEILAKDDRTLNYDDFCTLLYRLFTHKRGYYFKYWDDYRWKYTFYNKEEDAEAGERYIDYLKFVKNQDLVFYKVHVQ